MPRRPRHRTPRLLRRAHVTMRMRVAPYRWWTSPAFRKVELAPVTLFASALLLFWIGRTIWSHPGERTAGVEVALQLLAALIGGPILVARLLPSQVAASAADHRIRLSNTLRRPLRNRRQTRSIAAWLLVLGVSIAFSPNVWAGAAPWAEIVAVLLGLTAAVLIMLSWIGFLLPRRYTVQLPPTTPVFQPSQLVAKHQRAEAAAGALALVCIVTALILQFLRLYEIGPW